MKKTPLISLLLCSISTPGHSNIVLDTPEQFFELEKFLPLKSGIDHIYQTGLIEKNIVPTPASGFWLFPLTFSDSSSPDSSSSKPLQPSNEASLWSSSGMNDDDTVLTSLASEYADLSLASHPITFSFSRIEFQKFEQDADDKPSAALGAKMAVTMEEIKSKYPNLYGSIQDIFSRYPNLAQSFRLNEQMYELSPLVLHALNQVLGEISAERRVKSLRWLINTLQVNLFWRITNYELLVDLLRLYLNNHQHAYVLLSPLVSLHAHFSEAMPQQTAEALLVMILRLIAQNFSQPYIQQLLRQRLPVAALLAIILPDPLIQRRLDPWRMMSELNNIIIRKGNYGHIMANIRSALINSGMPDPIADIFVPWFFQLIRRQPAYYIGMTALPCQLHDTKLILNTLQEFLIPDASHQQPLSAEYNIVMAIMMNPAVFQTLKIFIELTQRFSSTHPIIIIARLFMEGIDNLPRNQCEDPLQLALWGLQISSGETNQSVSYQDISQEVADLQSALMFLGATGNTLSMAQWLHQLITQLEPDLLSGRIGEYIIEGFLKRLMGLRR